MQTGKTRKCGKHGVELASLSVWQEASVFLAEHDSVFGPDCGSLEGVVTCK